MTKPKICPWCEAKDGEPCGRLKERPLKCYRFAPYQWEPAEDEERT